MSESNQRAFSYPKIKRAELGVVFVVMEHVAAIFFGDAKTAATKVLGS